jgi:hypothetical protein
VQLPRRPGPVHPIPGPKQTTQPQESTGEQPPPRGKWRPERLTRGCLLRRREERLCLGQPAAPSPLAGVDFWGATVAEPGRFSAGGKSLKLERRRALRPHTASLPPALAACFDDTAWPEYPRVWRRRVTESPASVGKGEGSGETRGGSECSERRPSSSLCQSCALPARVGPVPHPRPLPRRLVRTTSQLT